MQTPFSKDLAQIADTMGIAMYQRFTPTEAALFLRCPIREITDLRKQGKLDYIEVTDTKIEFFGYQLLTYLLGCAKGTAVEGFNSGQADKILRAREVQEMTGLSRTTIWRLERKGEFPARVSLCPGSVGWRSSEVESWIKMR